VIAKDHSLATVQLIVARDAAGRAQAFHRYATAAGGGVITLDIPWRRRGAPNGIDERLSVDMVIAAKKPGRSVFRSLSRRFRKSSRIRTAAGPGGSATG
jgi:lysylphosphatidylglycerol synthetase-like protein (DUF2156 family)